MILIDSSMLILGALVKIFQIHINVVFAESYIHEPDGSFSFNLKLVLMSLIIDIVIKKPHLGDL